MICGYGGQFKIFLFDPADFKKFIKGSKRAVAGDLLFFENHITNVCITMREDINFLLILAIFIDINFFRI